METTKREFTETYPDFDNIASLSVMKWGGSINFPTGVSDSTVVGLANRMADAVGNGFTASEAIFQTGSGIGTIKAGFYSNVP